MIMLIQSICSLLNDFFRFVFGICGFNIDFFSRRSKLKNNEVISIQKIFGPRLSWNRTSLSRNRISLSRNRTSLKLDRTLLKQDQKTCHHVRSSLSGVRSSISGVRSSISEVRFQHKQGPIPA